MKKELKVCYTSFASLPIHLLLLIHSMNTLFVAGNFPKHWQYSSEETAAGKEYVGKNPAFFKPIFKWMLYFLHVLIIFSILMTFFCPSLESESGQCPLSQFHSHQELH